MVNDGIIEKITQDNIIVSDAKIFDLKDKFLMPGLIDAHVHVTATKFDLSNEHIPTSEASVQAAKFLENMLQRGFTSVRDAGGAASPTDRIDNLQYSREEIAAVVEEAHNAGLYVMGHAYSPDAIIRCVELGTYN